MTQKGNTIYLHIRDIPRFPVEVRELGGQVKSVKLVKTGEELPYKVQEIFGFLSGTEGSYSVNRISIDVSPEICDAWNTVIAIEFDQEPIWPVRK